MISVVWVTVSVMGAFLGGYFAKLISSKKEKMFSKNNLQEATETPKDEIKKDK